MVTKHRAMPMRSVAAAALMVALAGCVNTVSRETTTHFSNELLCAQYGHWSRYPPPNGSPDGVANVLAEMAARQMTPPTAEERALIVREQVAVGMSECAALASLGPPYAANRTLTANGRRVQYVYRPFAGRAGGYVYVEAGRVTAIQN